MSVAVGHFNYVHPSFIQRVATTGLGEEVKKDNSAEKNGSHHVISVPKTIKNGRLQTLHLKDDGFELLSNVTIPLSYEQLHDDKHIRERFYAMRSVFVPLATKLVQDHLSCPSIFAVHFTIPYVRRAADPNNANHVVVLPDHNLGTLPHAFVHSDYGPNYLQQIQNESTRNFLGLQNPVNAVKVAQQVQLAGRLIVLQFWASAQPENTEIETDALAVCHPDSVDPDKDLIERPLPVYNGYKNTSKASILQAKDSANHEWVYFPNMTRNECLVFVGYDSAWEGGGNSSRGPCLHSSVHLPTVPPMGRIRESVECRVMLMLDPKPGKLHSRL
jgi:hypothetical protein